MLRSRNVIAELDLPMTFLHGPDDCFTTIKEMRVYTAKNPKVVPSLEAGSTAGISLILGLQMAKSIPLACVLPLKATFPVSTTLPRSIVATLSPIQARTQFRYRLRDGRCSAALQDGPGWAAAGSRPDCCHYIISNPAHSYQLRGIAPRPASAL